MSSQGEATTDARAQAGAQRPGRDRRTRLRPNVRRGHYELAVEEPMKRRLAVAFDELALAI
jgi:hypothetical protein